MRLKNDYQKKGSIYIYIPESEGVNKAAVNVNGKQSSFELVAKPSIGENGDGSVVRVRVEIEGTKGDDDGSVSIRW